MNVPKFLWRERMGFGTLWAKVIVHRITAIKMKFMIHNLFDKVYLLDFQKLKTKNINFNNLKDYLHNFLDKVNEEKLVELSK